MRKSNEPNKMISMTIIAELVLLTLTLISRSACAFCFCQPSEPIALQSVIRERGRKMNKLNSIVLKFSSSLAALYPLEVVLTLPMMLYIPIPAIG